MYFWWAAGETWNRLLLGVKGLSNKYGTLRNRGAVRVRANDVIEAPPPPPLPHPPPPPHTHTHTPHLHINSWMSSTIAAFIPYLQTDLYVKLTPGLLTWTLSRRSGRCLRDFKIGGCVMRRHWYIIHYNNSFGSERAIGVPFFLSSRHLFAQGAFSRNLTCERWQRRSSFFFRHHGRFFSMEIINGSAHTLEWRKHGKECGLCPT